MGLAVCFLRTFAALFPIQVGNIIFLGETISLKTVDINPLVELGLSVTLKRCLIACTVDFELDLKAKSHSCLQADLLLNK